ncbi:MAG: DUF86 domain-containing protein [Spirochaetes bacterium]|nr:DUF86 domain-containing protein [Spirochaetota bacterium]
MRNNSLYLMDIKNAAEAIIDFTKEITFDEFKNDDKTLSAVIRKLEIIGEASKNLDPEITASHPDIPWSSMARMRDRLIHGYFGIDTDVIWKTIQSDIPEILPLIIGLYSTYKD